MADKKRHDGFGRRMFIMQISLQAFGFSSIGNIKKLLLSIRSKYIGELTLFDVRRCPTGPVNNHGDEFSESDLAKRGYNVSH